VSFGGLERNRAHFLDGGRVRFDGVDDVLRTLLLDPQTSGGLLIESRPLTRMRGSARVRRTGWRRRASERWPKAKA
jgi:selenophosphate synthase